MSLDGTWRAAEADDVLRRAYPAPDFDDRDWEPLTVPGHWSAAPAFAGSAGPVLHRRRFETPAPFGPGAFAGAAAAVPRRTWLVLEGAFYSSDVWLDGTYLGDTEGYFFPHAFEVTGALAARAEHTLAIEVACRPESETRASRALLGSFTPGPGGANPGGLWRPVRLDQSGPVRIARLRVRTADVTEEAATVVITAVLDSAGSTPTELRTTVAPVAPGAAGGPASTIEVTESRRWPLAGGENRIEWTVTVPRPRRWWPRALGDQPLHEVGIQVLVPGKPDAAAQRIPLPDGPLPDGVISDEQCRRVGLRTVSAEGWVFTVNGERIFLKGAAADPPRRDLATATAGELAAQVDRALEAGLDLLRLRAHVSRPELYDAADAAGLLVWQDLPMQGRQHRSLRRQARRQAIELVDLLAHHPSVLLWCARDEDHGGSSHPDARRAAGTGPEPDAPTLVRGALGRASWNQAVLDRSVRAALAGADGTRPALTHPPPGWRHDEGRDLATTLRLWPRLARFPSLTTGEGQVVKDRIETLRRLKYRPCGGFTVDAITDITAEALAAACTPVLVVADPLPPTVRPGQPLALDVHVVHDGRIALDDMILAAYLRWGDSARPNAPAPSGSTTTQHQWRWRGDVPPDDCTRIGTVQAVAPGAPGPLVLDLRLSPAHDPATVVAANRYTADVVAP